MLHNPKWDRHSLVGLRDWLATQNPEQVYFWYSCHDCVVGRFLRAHGETSAKYGEWIENTPGANRAVTDCFSDFAHGGGRETTTLGGALKKLDAWMLANMAMASNGYCSLRRK